MFKKIINLIKKHKNDKLKKIAANKLIEGYNFLKWIENTYYKNRHNRKLFYRDLMKYGIVNNQLIAMMALNLNNYLKPSKKPHTPANTPKTSTIKPQGTNLANGVTGGEEKRE